MRKVRGRIGKSLKDRFVVVGEPSPNYVIIQFVYYERASKVQRRIVQNRKIEFGRFGGKWKSRQDWIQGRDIGGSKLST